MTTQAGTQTLIATQIATLTSVEADEAKNLPDRIHLLRTGNFHTDKYGKLEITADDLKEFAEHFNAGYGRPGPEGQKSGLPVNISHNKGGVAAAWINNLEIEGDHLYGTELQWTGAGKAEVEAGNFKFISSEFTPRCLGGMWNSAENNLKKVRNVFTGAALTNIPMFNGNQGVMASAESTDSNDDKQTIYINAHEKEQEGMNIDQIRVKNKSDLTAEELTFVQANAASLSADEKTKFGIEAAADNTPQKVEASAVTAEMGLVSVEAAEIVELRTKVEAAEAAKKTAEDARTDLQKTVDAHADQLKDMKKKEIEATVDTHIKRGAIVADQRDNWVTKIEADETMQEMLEKLPSNKTVEADNLGADDNGNGVVTASDEADNKAKKLIEADSKLTYQEAISQVMASDTDLADRVQKESEVA